MALVIYVPQLGAALINRRSDIFKQEKRVDLFSFCPPKNFPSFSPRTVLECLRAEFEGSRRAVIEGLKKKQVFDLVRDFAMLVSGAALVAITGLRQMTPAQMD